MPCFILALLKMIIIKNFFFLFWWKCKCTHFCEKVAVYSRVFCLVTRVFWVICMFLDTISMFFLASVFCFWMVARSFYMVAYWSVILVFCSVEINGIFHFFYCLQRAEPLHLRRHSHMFNTLLFWGLFRSVMLSMSNNNSYDCIIKLH